MRTRSVIVFALAVGVMVLAGGAFVGKMFEFALTMAGDEVAGFGAVAVTTYLLGMLPLMLLMLWAVMTGRFRDIEAPKRRMLDLDREIERGGELGAGVRDEPDPRDPILAPRGGSPALASHPETELDHRLHTYEANPAPWWMAVVWLVFLVGGAAYLVVNLIP